MAWWAGGNNSQVALLQKRERTLASNHPLTLPAHAPNFHPKQMHPCGVEQQTQCFVYGGAQMKYFPTYPCLFFFLFIKN